MVDTSGLRVAIGGRGGNLIIIDDPLKPEDAQSESKRSAANDWFDRTLYSRLNNKHDDVIILVMQRLHIDDLVGYVLGKGEPWVHLNLPAIAEAEQYIPFGKDRIYHCPAGGLLHPERESAAELAQLKSALGSFNFSTQYQQCPVPPEGEIVKWEWFQTYDSTPALKPGNRIVQSWDTASRAGELNDYSVCTTWLVQAIQAGEFLEARETLVRAADVAQSLGSTENMVRAAHQRLNRTDGGAV